MTKPITHNKIQEILSNHKIDTHLTAPPKEYFAIISKKDEARTVSLKFRIPATTADMPNEAMVIHQLVSQYLRLKIIQADMSRCTLDYLIEEEAKPKNPKEIIIPGSEIRYTLKDDIKQKSPKWHYLDDSITIRIFPSDPFLIQDDETTVENNLKEAITELEAQIELTAETIKHHQQREIDLKGSLKVLNDLK